MEQSRRSNGSYGSNNNNNNHVVPPQYRKESVGRSSSVNPYQAPSSSLSSSNTAPSKKKKKKKMDDPSVISQKTTKTSKSSKRANSSKSSSSLRSSDASSQGGPRSANGNPTNDASVTSSSRQQQEQQSQQSLRGSSKEPVALTAGNRRRESEPSEIFNDEEAPTKPTSKKNRSGRSSRPAIDSSEQVPVQTVNLNFTSSSNNDNRNTKPRFLLLGMSKPVFAAACLLGMIAAAVTAYTVLEVTPLRRDVQDLEDQVDRLEGQVDRLQVENDRFNASNNQLNQSIAEFRQENQKLNQTKDRLNQSIDNITNTQIPQLQQTNADLKLLVQDIDGKNNQLNTTVIIPLRNSVQTMNQTVTALITDPTALAVLTNLSNRWAQLTLSNRQLTRSSSQLQTMVQPIREQNNALKSTLDELSDVTQVLGGTNDALSEQVQQAANEMQQQIKVNRRLGMARPQVGFHDAMAFWDCLVSDSFPSSFAAPDTPLDSDTLNNVLDAVQTHLFEPLCWSRDDVLLYLQEQYNGNGGISINEMLQGIQEYGQEAFKYYYPQASGGGDGSSSNGGITTEQWEQAKYQCSNLPSFEY